MRSFVSSVFLSIYLFVLTSLIAVQSVAYDAGYITRELSKLNSPKAVGMSEADVRRYAEQTAGYLRGALRDPNMKLFLDGEEKWFLNEREVLHMQDVQQLFTWSKYLSLLMLIALVLYGLFAYRQGGLKAYLLLLKRGAAGALLGGLLLALVISQDFTTSFTQFHVLSFNNDLWQLDPATDMLINLLPEQFFANAALQTGLRSGALLLALAITVYFSSRRLGN